MQAQAVEPEWITYEEAYRLTSLGRTTIYRIVTAGEVRSARLGRSVRIDRRSLEEYMERHAEEGSDDVG